MIDKIFIKGFRGFSDTQSVDLAIPNGVPGSGLTTIVGPNSGGKSTIIESFRNLGANNNNSFTEGKRHKSAGDRVQLTIRYNNGDSATLKTIKTGGSVAEWTFTGTDKRYPKLFFLPSRRVFNPYFSQGSWNRSQYVKNTSNFQFRGQALDGFSHRLFNALDNAQEYNKLLKRALGYELNWTIDQNDNNQFYVKIQKNGDIFHNSDGLGEGIVSLMFLIDALFESTPEELLVFDEPELSLHPQLQRKLLSLLREFSTDRQIVYATHSPELMCIDSILNGGNLVRVVNKSGSSRIYQLGGNAKSSLSNLVGGLFNPHILGYDARSCFFVEDGLVLVEGQEDVIFFNKATKDFGLKTYIPFFGFGSGGSGNIGHLATILKALGYENVICVYDGDKFSESRTTRIQFPDYKIFILPEDDIRTKLDKEGNVLKIGIFGADNKIREKHKKWMGKFINRVDRAIRA